MKDHVHRRFHLDQDGHSITVVWAPVPGRTEVLVDGKVVGSARTLRHAATELHGEIADGDVRRPLTIRVGRPDVAGGEPLCFVESEGRRYLMPLVPLTGGERWPAEPTPPARTPAQLLARWRAHRRHSRG
ncbi:hypothetical protein [Streptomyces sp. RerS4]|uniref:hypothetical protein n=1 Tax=Streptomyces sp. RerS4 TaxID=2942449 RepID=UPI00201CA7C1|nr:hypothetical protein [Streptomyces sp. RerS4]UQX04498.1 hypothetical protein M4D82_31300 [Streptomyces sp. RerS4]